MKVAKLIEILEECDPDAEVHVMSQEGWPFECAIAGVAVREDFTDYDDEDDHDAEDAAPPGDRWTAHDTKLPRRDVFIVEGRQLRYGSKRAWEVAEK